MTDRTVVFLSLCRAAAEKQGNLASTNDDNKKTHERSRRDEPIKLDAYTVEAKKINDHIESLITFLQSIRQSYLSTSTRYSTEQPWPATATSKRLTNAQRDEIDYESRLIIQQCSARVRQLEAVESNRQKQRLNHDNDDDDNDGGAEFSRSGLARFLFHVRNYDNDDRSKASATLGLHRQGVTQLLNFKLANASKMQTELQQIRVSRETEKARSMLNRTGDHHDIVTIPTPTTLAELDEKLARHDEQDEFATINPSLLQELEQENHALLAEFEETLRQAQQAEKSLYEIASLQGELATHLSQQSEVTRALYEEALETSGDVHGANKQLQSARKRNRIASKFIIIMSLGLAFFLLFVDYVTS
ncbi:hypothetical protein V1514DRAFT_330169 [Lipomyces japonicus]|uniref:uncharacterized protein n=1 Tax=Lipomyces japonicus TaxID=56871 RepID=UPI0034CF6C8C